MKKEDFDYIFRETREYYRLEKYKMSVINEMENGTLFGLVISAESFYHSYPNFYYDEGQIKNEIFIIEDCGCLIYDEERNSYFDDHVVIPLIFKKIKDNYVQEILTGNIFIAASPEKLKEDSIEFDSVEDFDSGIKEYSTANVFINTGFYNDDNSCGEKIGITDESCFFVVDDAFKKLYSDVTLKNKSEISYLLNGIVKNGKRLFTEGLDNVINEYQKIAETDNFLFDINNPKLK